MIERTQLIFLLMVATGALVLSSPICSAAAEAPTTSSGQPATPGEASPAGAGSQAPPAGTPTVAVQPEPTPAPPPPLAGPPGTPTPLVESQHAQAGTRATPAGRGRAKSRARGRHPAAKAAPGTAPGRPLRPRAPFPSALTPPLPLAFSASLSGIPTFFIESFRVPPFLLTLYEAAGTAYGVPWQVLAAINEVETDYGRDLSVSSAGAEGWMQFLPSSWAIYGVDANGDGFKDPYNPADAIFAAGRYLRAAGAATNLRGAIFAYNHSQAYVESVMLRARLLGGTPSELLGALTGLTQARFPVHAPSHFSDGFPTVRVRSAQPRAIAATTIYSSAGAPVIAVQDGEVSRIGRSPALGRFVSLRDAYGNTYTYAQLGRLARFYPVLQPHEGAASGSSPSRTREAAEPAPTGPASAGAQPRAHAQAGEAPAISGLAGGSPAGLAGASVFSATSSAGAAAIAPAPSTTVAPRPAPALGGASAQGSAAPASRSTPRAFRSGPNDVFLHSLRTGARVIAGTVLGHVGAGGPAAAAPGGEGGPHMLFQIRPAGAGAPLIDPKPILDGWVQLENTTIYRAGGANPSSAREPTPGQVLLESKQQLQQQVLGNRAIHIQRCGRQDVHEGQVDRRVLATLEFLAVSHLAPSTSGLSCAPGVAGAKAGTPAPASAQAVEISAVNGVAIARGGGRASIGQATIRKLRTLQGPMKPRQLALAGRGDRIHVSFAQPAIGGAHAAGAFSAGITPTEWIQLIARLGEIPSPSVRSGPSAASIPDLPAASSGGHGAAGAASGNR